MDWRNALLFACSGTFLCGCALGTHVGDTGRLPPGRVLPVSNIQWEALNPARGEMSPRAGTLWGDRTGSGATGFIASFREGFSSPPHIHNVSYRAVVIKGAIHNADPLSPPNWMGAGSFWTQPAGDVHITAASGKTNLALVETDSGPYLVSAPSKAFASNEKAVNVDASNLVWLKAQGFAASNANVRIAYLWGEFERGAWNGTFMKIPAGFSGRIESPAAALHAVVIKGYVSYRAPALVRLDPGSYFGADRPAEHVFAADPEGETTLYIRTNGSYEIAAD